VAGLLGIGASGVISYKSALDTIGHNISNANTEGYSRQRVELATHIPSYEGYGYVGNGVHVDSVERLYDRFVDAQIRNSTASESEFDTYHTYATQLDNLLADENLSLDPSIQNFFNAVQELADNPYSSISRDFLLAESDTLVNRVHYLNDQLDDTRSRINQDLAITVNDINGIASSLAGINQTIVTSAGVANGVEANDLLDQRDQLLRDLSALTNVTAVEQDNGAMNVFIGTGQALVIDNEARSLAITNSAVDASKKDITFVTTSSSATITDQLTGGRIGGILNFQDEMLDPAQNELGRVVVSLVAQFNAQHQLGVDLSGTRGGDFFTALNTTLNPDALANANNTGTGNVGATYSNLPLSDYSDLTASDYELRSVDGGDVYTLTRLSDNFTFNTIDLDSVTPAPTTVIDPNDPASLAVDPAAGTVTVDGITLTVTAGADAGDRFRIQPTRDAGFEVGLTITDPNTIAAAGPLRASEKLDANGMPTNAGTATITHPVATSIADLPLSGSGGDIELRFNPNAGGAGIPGFDVISGAAVVGPPVNVLLYDPATESTGKTFSTALDPNFFTVGTDGDMSFTISGLPATGDSFVITDNMNSAGDNRNALALAGIQNSQSMISGTATLQESYSQMVSSIGAGTRSAEINMESHQGLLDQAVLTRDSISGVSLDEEAADLLRYQQAYQAAAQVVSVASTLFDTLIAAVRR